MSQRVTGFVVVQCVAASVIVARLVGLGGLGARARAGARESKSWSSTKSGNKSNRRSNRPGATGRQEQEQQQSRSNSKSRSKIPPQSDNGDSHPVKHRKTTFKISIGGPPA